MTMFSSNGGWGNSAWRCKAVSRIADRVQVDVQTRRRCWSRNPTSARWRGLVADFAQGSHADVQRIRRARSTGHMRLSSHQEQLWFLNQLEPGQPGLQ